MKKLLIAGLLLGPICIGFVLLLRSRPATVLPAQGTPQTDAKPNRKQLWTCGMHPQVIEDHPGNCPICHMRLTPLKMEDDAGGSDKKVAYWWDPMLGPSSIASHPGKSAMGMDLVPVYEQDVQGGPDVHIDPAVVQNMGVQTAEVTRGPMTRSVQTVGLLEAPETGLHDISPRVGGWIDKLFANQEGMHVHRGDPLFDLYSPELLVAEQELVGAIRSARALGASGDEPVEKSSQALVESAKVKLRLLDVGEADIDTIAQTLTAPRAVTFRSPASGAVIDKAIVEGSATQSGQKLMRIEDHSSLWLDLQVYEDQMMMVAVGEDVSASVEAFPGRVFKGRITFVHPHVDHMSRTVIARAVLDNPDLALRPGMYASATILTRPIADALQAPREAVIDTGTRQIVFIAEPDGHFQPRAVRVGISGDDGRAQLLDGVAPGERVVTSGQFLLDVESRTTEAIQKLRSPSLPSAEMLPVISSMHPTTLPVNAASPPQPGTTLAVAWCPMKKAHWLQRGDPIANPYFGTQMPGCGEVQRTLAVPEPSSPLSGVANAYLQLTTNFAIDRFDPSAAEALRRAAEKLDASQLSEVRSASLAVAAASDLSAARAALIPLSEALLRASTGDRDPRPSSMPTMPGMEGMRP